MKETLLRAIRYMIVLLVISPPVFASASGNAQSIFERWRSEVYQIRVIDIASADKFSIGSGFLVSPQGHIATNFHVVSSYVHEPDKYTLELVNEQGETQALSLLAIDVIHDLAITQAEGLGTHGLPLSQRGLKNGDRIFSMGNPHDLGMTVIEGTYNGFVQHVRHQQILFSGSLNAGMSGGPAFNAAGEVIGVNVSTGGEQISFLVPVNFLDDLLQQAKNTPRNTQLSTAQKQFQDTITQALLADQEKFYAAILTKAVELEKLEEYSVPVNLSDSLKCWGHTQDKDEELYKGIHQHCRSEDRIFVSGDLYAGHFSYNYEWMDSDQLNALQFYSAVQQRFKHAKLASSYDDEEVSNFNCHSDRLEIQGQHWKASSCLRAYLKYPGLYDASFVMASLEHKDKTLLVKIGATAISKTNAQGLMQYMMENVQWQP